MVKARIHSLISRSGGDLLGYSTGRVLDMCLLSKYCGKCAKKCAELGSDEFQQ